MFNNIRKQAKVDTTTTVPFEFEALEGCPVVHVIAATKENKPYINALLERTQTPKRRRKQRQQFDPDEAIKMLEKQAEIDVELYPQFVIKGWENVVDDKGNAVPFSVEAAREFCEAIQGPLFEELQMFCTNYANFTDLETEDTAKN